MRFLTRPRIQWAGGGLAAWLALAAPAPGRAAAALDVVRTTKAAPAGFVEIGGVEAGAFNPAIWQAGTLHWVPDLRSPLLAPRSGKFRNIYAPSAVETPGGYRLFYGAWDGLPTGNDCIYSATTDANFQKFSHRRAIIVPGGYVHVCNVNALGLDGGGFELLATVYPVRERNKPGFFRSDATGTNWNGGRGEPYTVRARDIIAMDGYAYPNADINGMNVLLREDGARRLYFGDFRGGGGTFRATSRDGRNYTFEAKVLAGPGLVNDVKKFRVGADCYYLMGLHENRRRLWQTISTNGLAFPPARELLAHLDAADAYIVALGWVTRGAQESPGRRLLGVLYGAGPVSALDQNRIYARWLQKRVDFVARDGTRISGTRALGPGQQLLDFAGSPARRGRFELYAEDGVTRLGVSPEFDVQSGQVFHLR
ncbi:MAG TPA: hypothetical protein PK751_07310 [Verrucomicrobiota bacterium]|jgi:hypothetical protein|nr:hypothetical protein [Verrucomicrobiota bacterium]HOH38961.1 hypothetical protein [Verrucomicrobiota bacterium]HQB72935.1 hypothetical protein [Verrucomicrobiota bacterium]